MSSVAIKNQELIRQLEEGDLVEFPRGLYSHWGVYEGNGKVIHVTDALDNNTERLIPFTSSRISSLSCSAQRAVVRRADLSEVAGKSLAKKNNKRASAFTRQEIVRKARTMVDKEYDFNVLYNNCEHFANWCRYGVETSDKADVVLSILNPLRVRLSLEA